MRQIEAHSLTNDIPPTILQPAGSANLYAGGTEQKQLLALTVGDRHVSMVQRDYDQRYVDNWLRFRAAGLPVAPTLREADIDGQKKLLVTDFKADGSELYGKGLESVLSSSYPRERKPARPVDKHFLDITSPEKIAAVEASARHYREVATEHGLVLPADDPFELQVHPDGKWNLVIVDLRLAEQVPESTFRTQPGYTKQANTQVVGNFFDSIQGIRGRMRPARRVQRLAKVAAGSVLNRA